MKKILVVVMSVYIFGTYSVVEAQSFKNCSEVRKTYPMGVARSLTAAKKQKNYPVNNPFVSAPIYNSIAKMDRDKDGTACEN